MLAGSIPLLFLGLANTIGGIITPVVGVSINSTLNRDPFYVSHVPVNQQSRYDIAAPKILGIISTDDKSGAIIRFDDKTEVAYVGDVVREHVIVSIRDDEVIVVDGDRKEKRWLI